MGFYISAAIIAVAVSSGLVFVIRRNLADREKSRHLRAIFVAAAGDLVGKPELPDAHARQLVMLANIPEGWLTRFMVLVLLKRMLVGAGQRRTQGIPIFDQVPANLRPQYVTALLSFALSDSYRCAIFGQIWRAAYGWVGDAVKEIKPDVNAHATRTVVEQMSSMPSRRAAALVTC